MRSGRLNRTLTLSECEWLDGPLREDTVVFEYTGHTYGCISTPGIAITLESGKTPFIQVPPSAIDWD